MPRQKSPEPRSFVIEGKYPFGPFAADAPIYALAAALFTRNLLAYMDGSLSIYGAEPSGIEQDPNMFSLVKKAEIGRAVLSRVLNGVSYPDMTTVARLEAYTAADLWGTDFERRELASGTYNPSMRASWRG
jgi:hypothetical protein